MSCRTEALSLRQVRCQKNLESPGPGVEFRPVVLASALPSWTLHLSIVKMRGASAPGAWSPQAASSTGLAHAEHCPSLPFYFPFSLCRPLPPTCPPPAAHLPPTSCLSHASTLWDPHPCTCLGGAWCLAHAIPSPGVPSLWHQLLGASSNAHGLQFSLCVALRFPSRRSPVTPSLPALFYGHTCQLASSQGSAVPFARLNSPAPDTMPSIQ